MNTTNWTDFFKRLYPSTSFPVASSTEWKAPPFGALKTDTEDTTSAATTARDDTTFQSLMDQINSLQVSKNTPTAVTGGSPLGIRSARTPMQKKQLATGTNRLSRDKYSKNTTLNI